MAQYGTFVYGTGELYGSELSRVNRFVVNTNDPTLGVVARYVRVVLKYSAKEQWAIDAIRVLMARRQHVLPRWRVPVQQLLKRTRVTLKYTGTDFWAIDVIRLKQMIRNRRPTD